VEWSIPDNFDWRRYRQLSPAEYDWPMVLGPPGECRDEVASPHPFLFVGSSQSDIPDDAVIVLNVADNCPRRPDVGGRKHIHLPLSDPFAMSSIAMFVEAVRIAVAKATRRRATFVHCMCGMSRSVSIVATAAAMLRGECVIDVLAEMSEQRPEIYPDEAYIILGQWLNEELPDLGVL